MRCILKILIAVFACLLIAPAFSAVENVKVGGDIAVYGVLRSDFDVYNDNEDLHFFQTAARVYVSADLSDNVSTMIRLTNESAWGVSDTSYQDDLEIVLDLAYIKVTDLLTPGLTLTVGRQEIELGEGLVVGSRYRAGGDYPRAWALGATDLGVQKAFDAVKIDYSATAFPLNVTAFLSKIYEGFEDDNYEETLYGIDLGFKVAEVANIDVYYVRYTVDEPIDSTLDTAGIRVVSGIPAIEGLTLKGEYAKQFGDSGSVDYAGWALLLGASYKFATNMEPTIKVNYNLYSGDDDSDNDWEAWVPVFPSNVGSRIGPLLYAYDAYNFGGAVVSMGNASVINLGFSIKPTEKLTVSLDGYMVKFKEDMFGVGKDIAKEIDLGIEYKYSEDLTIGLNLGKLLADDAIEEIDGDDAWQAIASMKIAF